MKPNSTISPLIDHNAVGLKSLDRLVITSVDTMLAYGVSASLAYWFVLLTRLPVWSWYLAFIFIVGTLIYLFRNYFSSPLMVKTSGWALALLLICVMSASINIFTNRPDSDDIAFSHRAFVAATNLSMPIAMTNTAHDVVNLPPVTPLHVFTSVEVTTALVARSLGIPQLLALYMGLGSLSNFMLPAIYFLLLRFFRIPIPYAVLGTLGILLFFVMSGNVHRDWGNFTILRSWQGKCILMQIILPLALLYSLRFNLYGRRSDLIRLQAIMCCGIGLSCTGLFLVPFVIMTSALSIWVLTKFSRRSFVRIGISSCVFFQVLIVYALLRLGFLPELGDTSFFTIGGWPVNYAENLSMVFHPQSIPLYFTYLCTALLVKKRAEFFGFIIYLGIALLFITAPGIRNLLMSAVTPGAYWRFSYALFVPLFVGLALAGLLRHIVCSGISRVLAVTWLVMLMYATYAIKTPAVNHKTISKPGPKFPPNIMSQTYKISDLVNEGSVILSPENIVVPLGLLRPDVKFIITRTGGTMTRFRSVGREHEGIQRAKLRAAVESCNINNISIRSAQLWPEMNAVVYATHCSSLRIRTLLMLGNNWENYLLKDYQVLVRTSI